MVASVFLKLLPFLIALAVGYFLYQKREERIREKEYEEYREQQRAERERIRKEKEEKQRQIELAWAEGSRQNEIKRKQKEQAELEEQEKYEKEKQLQEKKLYLESELTVEERETLFAHDYRRLKISPNGKSGSSFYWVLKRWNESKEHAFFCYLIQNKLQKRGRDVVLHETDGPDVEFVWKWRKYCIEVETGSNLERNPDYVARKFEEKNDEFDECFVFVTKKKLKYPYSKYAKVVTRATLDQTLERIFKRE